MLAVDDIAAGFAGDAPQPEQQRAEDDDPRDAVQRHVDIADVDRNRFQYDDQVIQQAKQIQQYQRRTDPAKQPGDDIAGNEIANDGVKQQQHRDAHRNLVDPVMLLQGRADFDRYSQQHDGQYRKQQATQLAAELPQRKLRIIVSARLEKGQEMTNSARQEKRNQVNDDHDEQLAIGFRLGQRVAHPGRGLFQQLIDFIDSHCDFQRTSHICLADCG